MYRDGTIDDDDWYDDDADFDEDYEPTWRDIVKGVGYIYGVLFLISALATGPGQRIGAAIGGQADFILAVVPGMWLP